MILTTPYFTENLNYIEGRLKTIPRLETIPQSCENEETLNLGSWAKEG